MVLNNNYKRVRVEFPLAKPIPRSVQQKVKGHGILEFMVKYENIPHFYFRVAALAMLSGNAQMMKVRKVIYTLGRRYDAPPRSEAWGVVWSSRRPPHLQRQGLISVVSKGGESWMGTSLPMIHQGELGLYQVGGGMMIVVRRVIA
jgi:hypothetical protein